ncbi:MAG: hypothetical protein E5X48_28985 [Mesorhizobium sp.]|uniref:hypothetical protein n=1 Tax=Mesorhizobium sp. TaxID=1871066 RepID=UPI001212A1EB|nr:hypothetical protein [Mesorhizobium sp.]TIQ30452.1 MAG: hypothetical protein E5X48_28985 [Mesorhizobium sp.]
MTQAGARAGDQPHLALFVVPHASIAKRSIFSAGGLPAHGGKDVFRLIRDPKSRPQGKGLPRPACNWRIDDDAPFGKNLSGQ